MGLAHQFFCHLSSISPPWDPTVYALGGQSLYWVPMAAITNVMAQNNRHGLLHKSTVSTAEGPARTVLLPEALGEGPFFTDFSFQWLPACLGLWLHHSNSCLHDHTALSSVCQICHWLCRHLVKIFTIGFMTYPNNPRWSLHLKILSHTCKAFGTLGNIHWF